MIKKFLLISSFLFSSFYFIFLPPAFAQENFLTSYDVTYTVLESGLTHVAINVALTNTTSQYYASSYKIKAGFSNIRNISASDPDGLITPEIEKSTEGYSIGVNFNKRVVGVNNVLPFNISFDTDDVVQKQGTIWEVNVPGVSDQRDFSNFSVHVKVPPSLGSPTYIKPIQAIQDLNFNKEQLGKSGISIGFGKNQSYGFVLDYHLKNTHVFPIKTEIALPPSTNYQDVSIESILPKPTNVIIDKDGNWLAQYSLAPSQKIDVKVKGKAQVNLYPKKQTQSEKELSQYLKETFYWQTKNEEIIKLSKSLKTPRAIYEYVVRNLNYDFSRVTENKPRLGAVEVLKNPSSAVCLEFTDLFIAIARASGIPAREVDGFAYTQNETQRPLSLEKDVLHAWPEYYDKELETWVMIDPTWGNTTGGTDYFDTLDFDHFAFVIKGIDSRYPITAGGYKQAETKNKKDVNVYFTDPFNPALPALTSIFSLPSAVLAGTPIGGFITLKNDGPTLYSSQLITLSSDFLSPITKNIKVNSIPPFGFIKIPVSFSKTSILTNTQAKVTIRVAEKEISQNIKITPFYLTKWAIIGGISVAGITIIIISVFAARTRRISLFRQKEAGSVRGKGQKPQ